MTQRDLIERPRTLVLFDIDGTLLNSAGCGREAMRLALLDVFGRTGDIDRHHLHGKTDWQSVAELLRLSDEEVGAHMPAFEQASAYHLERIIGQYDVRPYPGTLALVDALAQKPAALLGLLTGNVRAIAPIKLRAAGFDPGAFRLGAYGSEARRRDALPAMALARAEALTGERFPGERIVIIGDTEADVTCGRTIGARSLAVATGSSSYDRLAAQNPDHLFYDLTDLPAVVAAIFSGG